MITKGFLSHVVSNADDVGMFVVCGFGEGGRGATARVWPSDPTALETLASWIADRNAAGLNVYWGAALMRGDLPPGSRGTAADVQAMLAIVIDLDDPTAAANWEIRARAFGPVALAPTIVVRTSSTPAPRYQLVFLLREPETDIGAWRRAAHRLEAWFGADHCSKDPAHVWRIPGTLNIPNEKKRAAGRIEEESVVVVFDGPTYEVGDFDLLPDPVSADTADTRADGPIEIVTGASRNWSSWNDVLAHLPTWMQRDIITDANPHSKEDGTSDRSAWDWQIACEVRRAGLTLGDLQFLYKDGWREVFAARFLDRERQRTGLGFAYLAQTYAKAAQKIAAEPPPGASPDEEWTPDPEDTRVVSLESLWDLGVMDIERLWSEEDEPIEYWIEPWLQKGAITMLHGGSGVGKSYYLGHQLFALAVGKPAGPYSVSAPARVLYIDCEMSKSYIRRRTKAFVRTYGLAPDGTVSPEVHNFRLWSPYAQRGVEIPLDIRNADTQRQIVRQAELFRADVIVIDNVRSATPGMEEKDRQSWDALNEFWQRLRNLGLTVVWVHHDNKPTGDNLSYAGSSNAIKSVEVEMHLVALGQEEVDARNGFWAELFPDGSRTVRNAIEVRYGKHRERDVRTHRTHKLEYIEVGEDGPVYLQSVAVNNSMEGAASTMELDAYVWLLMSGRLGAKLSARAIEERGITSKSSAARIFKRVETSPDQMRDILGRFETMLGRAGSNAVPG